MNPAFLLLLLSVLGSALAQLSLKNASMRIGDRLAALPVSPAPGLAQKALLVLDPFLILGFGLFGFSLILWLFVLRTVPVSFAYPFTAIGIVITTIGGAALFGESINLMRCAAILVIVTGLGLLALSR